ncbi:Ldh family oxidoreductase [Desulfoscipio geothermicus]|uniref:Malate/lactate/ureidoglycolate dehydrogenase, LDH2 family n=1 Tax=Desulfoscipio geothermicus DSM 3669 TaxID=1121426 RepID=A0A1I6DWI3_9FIRM|nr:Ldh family oxidoreductase [Desulfoscipio geothermicus]SFR09638.1 Malate/lactate/ureidoglycolate dehydrogenase, LDH2 family [Desulfoscipio geothermicus DSM 3669]
MQHKIPAEYVQKFCAHLLEGTGVPREDAEIVATVLVDTSLDGIDTHSISRLPVYLTRLQNGRINARPNIKPTRTAPSVVVLDGDNGLGQLVSVRAMEKAIETARETGVGVVSARHSNHFGAATYYCKMAADAGMIGMAFTNSPPGIPPWGGKKPYFGTNPISFGFPKKGDPVVVDMSSSTVARGNIILAAKEDRPIPEGWAIDADGRPTTDAQEALKGAVLPIGGPKGYALALAVEILSGVVSGAAYGSHVGWIYDDSLEPVNIGHFFIAMNIEPLMPMHEYMVRMEQMVSEIKAVPKAQGCDHILLPGERKQMKAIQRLREGIPVNARLLNELNNIATSLGVEKINP